MDEPLVIPEMILIAGSGQNRGKTTLAEEIITFLSEWIPVTGIKTTPHFHMLPSDTTYVFKAMPDYMIAKEENRQSEKDTSRMLRAGCRDAYLILAADENLKPAFLKLYRQFSFPANHIIVCESPAFAQIAVPGLFFFMRDQTEFPEKMTSVPGRNKQFALMLRDLPEKRLWLQNILKNWLKTMPNFQVPF